jgi:hypothetical protein
VPDAAMALCSPQIQRPSLELPYLHPSGLPISTMSGSIGGRCQGGERDRNRGRSEAE